MTIDTNNPALAELRLRLQADLKPTRSPYPPWPDDEILAKLVLQHGYPALSRIAKLYVERERSIRKAREDRFHYGWEWDCWKRADKYLPIRPWIPDPAMGLWCPENHYRVLAVLGGNRASKSGWSIKRCVQTLVRFPNTRMIFLCQKFETSRQVQQEYVWHYLPAALKALNFKKDPGRIFYIRYQKGTGFSEQKFVLPNGSEGIFLVYTQNPSDYEGIQIGCPNVPGAIAWAADESLTLDWLQLLTTRSATYDGTGLWTFTAVDGMTPALKETVGEGKILEHRFAEALADRQNLPDIPKGYMPTVQEGARSNVIVIYFHTDENPMGGYERVRADCEGKPTYFKERKLYGYARELKGRVFTHFGAWNIVPPETIPKEGTVYFHGDPAGARNWFMLWAVVDRDGCVWVYDEWPTVSELGEWAVPTTRNPSESGGRGWDGDQGPAQSPIGYGIVQYKRLILRREQATIGLPAAAPAGPVLIQPRLRRLTPPGPGGQRGVFRRTVDRRAGPSPLPQESGETTCISDQLNQAQTDPKTDEVLAPMLAFDLAGGPGLEDDGLEMIKQALYVDRERALDPLTNFPKLFVSSSCQNLIWALQNFTGRDGQKGACKDPIDCLRDLFTSGLEFQSPEMYGSSGGGSY